MNERERNVKKQKVEELKKATLPIPTTSHYEVSFLHKSQITHILSSSKHGFLLSCSQDGILKFWKRSLSKGIGNWMTTNTNSNTQSSSKNDIIITPCLEFVKSYQAHIGTILDLSMDTFEDHAVSLGKDGCVKLYDISTYDVRGMMDIPHFPEGVTSGLVIFVAKKQDYIAVTYNENTPIQVFDISTCFSNDKDIKPVQVLSLHNNNIISCWVYDSISDCSISCDVKGFIEIWDCGIITKSITQEEEIVTVSQLSCTLPKYPQIVKYESKYDTDYYTLLKHKTFALSIAITTSRQNHYIAIYGYDRKIRLFNFTTGKMIVTYDERLSYYDDIVTKRSISLDVVEYGKRSATEREIQDSSIFTKFHPNQTNELYQSITLSFDPTNTYLLYPTLVGIKVIHIKTHKCVATLVSNDASTNRFLSVCMCFVSNETYKNTSFDTQLLLARGVAASIATNKDKSQKNIPYVITTAYNKKRLYVFSNNDPITETEEQDKTALLLQQRDIQNEPPDGEDVLLLPSNHSKEKETGKEAVIRTSLGDIHIKLFPAQCPTTIENFCTHSRNGYYDNVIFHRIIKGFMIQTGDPLGTGTGGESIWGHDFEDEIHRDLKHDRPFTVSMANAGPGTNGSQFFITTVPTPWLDGKHTVFGRVFRGMDVCLEIEGVSTNDSDKPWKDVCILSIDIL